MSNSLLSDPIYLDDVPKEQFKQYIGNGYRSVCYLVDPATRIGKIVLFGYDTADNPKTFIIPWKSHVKYVVKYQTQERDIYDRFIKEKEFNNIFERKKWVEAATGLKIVECLRPEQEVLHFLFDDVVLNDGFNTQPLRIHYFDIETEISEQFERPAQARNRINMMTVYDTLTEKFYTWSLQHAEIDFKEEPLKSYSKDKFVFFEFHDDEVAMLEHFLSWNEDNYADVQMGWNSKLYDVPYLVRRIENILGKGAAQRLSPVSKYFIKQIKSASSNDTDDIEVSIDGLFIADGLVLYRDKFGFSKPDGGYTLDNIGEVEGCGHKIHYDGTLKDLYLKDYQKFYEYNVRDVDLVKRIEEKCKIIQLSRTITSFGLSQYSTIYSSISYLVGSLTSFAKTQMNRTMCSYVGEKRHFDGFEGAFVFPAQQGLYKGGNGTCDFASLYPSGIRCCNISPETYRGKVLIQFKSSDGTLLPVNEKDELYFDIFDDKTAKASNVAAFYLKQPDGRRVKVDLDKLRAWIEQHGIYTPNNTIFLKHEEKWGIVPKWCEYFYGQRKATKKKMLAIYHELHDPSKSFTEQEVQKKEAEEEVYNSRQGAMKNMLNSVYGQMGNEFSPIANLDVAQSVTRLGKFCNISSSQFILDEFRKKYDPDYKGFWIYPVAEDDPRAKGMKKIEVIAISGDTDSIFIDLTAVTNWMKKKYGLPKLIKHWTQEKRQELWDTMISFIDNDVNTYVRTLVHNRCKTNQQNVLTYEFEYMGDAILLESKKHYFTHVIFNEGSAVSKNKVTGISLKKGETDKAMKSFLTEIYEGAVVNDWEEKDYQDYIQQLYEKFKTFSIDEVSFWKGYGTERAAAGFLQMEKGTTGIAKCCNYYNQLIDKLGLGKKYDQILVGDKVRMCYIEDSNPYGISQIAYKPGQWPKEFNKLFKVDYPVMFNKIILDQLKKFREACHFQEFDPRKSVVQDIFEL